MMPIDARPGDAAGAGGVGANVMGIANFLDLPIIVIGPDCLIKCVNEAARTALGLRPCAIGRPLGSSLPAVEAIEALCMRSLSDGAALGREIPIGDRWFAMRISPYRGSDGEMEGAVLTFADVTAFRANIDQAAVLRQLQVIAENMDAGLTRCSRDLRYLWASRSYAAWLGLTQEEISGRSIDSVIGKQGLEDLRPHIEKVLSGERTEFETQVTFPDARKRWKHAVYVPTKGQDNAVDGWIGIVRDVTDRHEAEERLRASERQLRDAQRLAKVGSWIKEIGTEEVYWSDEIIRILGLPDDTQPDFGTFMSLVHPKDRGKIIEDEQRTVSGAAPLHSEFRIIRPDGNVRLIRTIAEAIKDDQGLPVRLVGAVQDITEQVNAHELLRQSEARLKNAERIANVGHWDWDVVRDKVIWSDGTHRIYGQPPDYAPSFEDVLRVTVPDDRVRFEHVVRSALAEHRGFVVEFQITRSGGDVRTVRSVAEVVLSEDEGLPIRMFGTVQDITDERRAQEESLTRQKLEVVGTLAGGVAHDFNNLLGSAMSLAELGLAELQTGASPEEELKTIREVAMRGSEIVRQLMVYAGKERAVIEPLDVSRIVLEMLELLKVTVSKHALVEAALGRDLPAVRANAAQLRQVVMNLVMNASEAIGDRDGVIRVSTELVTSAAGSGNGTGSPFATRDHVQLEVSDTGRGMPREIASKVFDPFFTTKPTGHGLGLATVQGIVRNLGGEIELTSEPGKGTTFRILIPCAEIGTQSSRDSTFTEQRPERSSARAAIMVVEDEDPLRHAVAKMLRNSGWSVLEAAEGISAIGMLRANKSKIDLILLDVTMPGASNEEILAEVSISQPDTRVILTSAYSQEMFTTIMNSRQVRGFIRKPFQLTELVKTVQDILSS